MSQRRVSIQEALAGPFDCPRVAEARGGRGAWAARGERAAIGTFEAGAEEGASAEGGWGRPSASYIRGGSVLLPGVWGSAQGAGVPDGAGGSAGDIEAPGPALAAAEAFPGAGAPQRAWWG